MKIIVTEMNGVSSSEEREFVLPIVKVGRDTDKCHIVFDRVTWPMVSRTHGEFRFKDGKCLVFDTNSTFGTFLNGQRVKGSAEVKVGSLIQFGTGGPIVRIRSVEENAGTFDYEQAADSPLSGEEGIRTAELVRLKPASKLPSSATNDQLALLELVDELSDVNQQVQLGNETVLLGRDPGSLVPLTSGAVSRRHAEIQRSNGQFILVDLSSYNGTFVNNQRVKEPTFIYNNDLIQLGIDGPRLRLIKPANPALSQRSVLQPHLNQDEKHWSTALPLANMSSEHSKGSKTLVALPKAHSEFQAMCTLGIQNMQPFIERTFDNKPYISVGRRADNDIRLESLQVSAHHARFIKDQTEILIEDKGSTNGVFVNGERIGRGRKRVGPHDVVHISHFVLQATSNGSVVVFDTRSKARIDAININKVVAESSHKSLKLLDAVDLTIHPNEFVGLLGPSGAGKSTLMDALNGMSQPTAGHVFINNLDLYQHLDFLKHSIGYVPQEDIIHRELTVYRTLLYVAGLRLSRDVSSAEEDQIINEVLDVTGLSERRDVPVGQLSGGQRKRVSIAVELITKPSIIFLDEPTSGLDPATEEKIMKLFRRIAESGRTVVLTTHNTANVHLFDKVVVLMHGKLVFYGKPADALAHFNVTSFKNLYDVLEAPPAVDSQGVAPATPLAPKNEPDKRSLKPNSSELLAEEWKRRFQRSELYQRNVVTPLQDANRNERSNRVRRPRLKLTLAIRHLLTLVRRYSEILLHDRMTMLVTFAQAPVIALLTYLVINDKAPRDFPYFMLALVATWFGTSVASREIIRERAVFNRERMVNLGLIPYVASKITVLAVVVSVQCALLLGALKGLHYANLIYLPGSYGGLPQLLTMMLTGIVGIALGLLVSAIVRTSETATSLVPLLLIPQILFAGMNGAPKGVAKVVGATMPVTWSFDQMKRLSNLEPLNEEGSIPQYMEGRSRQESNKAQKAMEEYEREVNKNVDDYRHQVEKYLAEARTNTYVSPPQPPKLTTVTQLPEAKRNDNLKDFVSFTHSWGGTALNTIVLVAMLLLFVVSTLSVLRAQDKG